MKEKKQNTDTFNCPYVKSVGQNAVYVSQHCQHLHIIKGVLATTKSECRKCKGGDHDM